MKSQLESALHFVPVANLHGSPRRVSCKDGLIDVWAFDLRSDDALLAACQELLSSEETSRADRFVFEQHRRAFAIARATLRVILGWYVDRPAASLVFGETSSGKPFLVRADSTGNPVFFNLSHSGERALLAVASRELGADIEQERSDVSAREIGSRYFAPREQSVIAASADNQLLEMFFRYWVAKESVLKAQGIGLGFDLHRFCVEFNAGHTHATVTSDDTSALSADWQVRVLPVGTGWQAAVCARGGHWQIRIPAIDSSDQSSISSRSSSA